MDFKQNLKPEETMLVGYWLDLGSSVEKDAVWERINWLVESRLELLASDDSGSNLYRDPADGRCWELKRRAAHLKEGGPPQLSVISAEEAGEKYPAQSTGR